MNHKKKQFCPRNHDTFVVGRAANGQCTECFIAYQTEYQKDYDNEHKDIKEKYVRDCKKGIKLKKKKLYEKDKERILARNKKWREGHKKEIKEQNEKYRKSHPELYRLIRLRRHAKRKLRIVPWGQRGMRNFYINCPYEMVVDHYIPLCGTKVSGLHVIWNLQYLTPHDNAIKHNKCNLLEVSEWYGRLLEKEGLK